MTNMKEKDERIKSLESYLFGTRPNYVKATLKLKEIADSYPKTTSGVNKHAEYLLDILKEGNRIRKQDVSRLAEKIEGYKVRERQDDYKSEQELENIREMEEYIWNYNHPV